MSPSTPLITKPAPVNHFQKLTPELRKHVYSYLELQRPAHIHLIAFKLADTSRCVYLFEGFVRTRRAKDSSPVLDYSNEAFHINNGHSAIQCYRAPCLTSKAFLEEVRPTFLGLMKFSIQIQAHRVFWRKRNYGTYFFEYDLETRQFPLHRLQIQPRIMDCIRDCEITIKPNEYLWALDHEKNKWLEALTRAIEFSCHTITIHGKKICVRSVWQGMAYDSRGQGRYVLGEEESRMNELVVRHVADRVEVTADVLNHDLRDGSVIWDHEASGQLLRAISPIVDEEEKNDLSAEMEPKFIDPKRKDRSKHGESCSGNVFDSDESFDSDWESHDEEMETWV